MSKGDSIHGVLVPVGQNELADKIRTAIGAGSDEVVEVVTPQFTRPVGEPGPANPSRDPKWWAALREMDYNALKEMGLGVWDKRDGKALMLIPGEWYDFIPSGFEIVDICGFDFAKLHTEPEFFVPGETDNDIQFGHLAYGFIVECKESR
jgi:hypothetical protein